MKKLILLSLFIGIVPIYAMEQPAKEVQEIRELIRTMKAKKTITLGQCLKSGLPIVSCMSEWWHKKVAPSLLTPEENELCSRFINNASLTQNSVEGISQEDLATLKQKMRPEGTPQQLTADEDSDSYQKKALEDFSLFATSFAKRKGATDSSKIQELITENAAQMIVEYMQRKKGIINTIGGVEAPQELITWNDEWYVPYVVQNYLGEINEEKLIEKASQLMAVDKK